MLTAADCQRCPTPPSDPNLDQARAGLSEAYAQVALCPPCEDSILSKAARAIVAGPRETLPDPVALQRAVQEAGGGDPSPRAMLLSARDPKALLRDLDQQWHPQAGDEIVGLGLARTQGGVRLVILAAERKASVEPLPARIPVGAEVRISGALLGALHSPSVYVEGPNGRVVQIKPALSGSRFSARFEPSAIGSYAIEVLAQSARGPEVVFLKSIEVGRTGGEELPPRAEPASPDDDAAVLDQINRERLRYGAAALAPDPRLARVAQAYARELRELGIFAHVSPRSGDSEGEAQAGRLCLSGARPRISPRVPLRCRRRPLRPTARPTGEPCSTRNTRAAGSGCRGPSRGTAAPMCCWWKSLPWMGVEPSGHF